MIVGQQRHQRPGQPADRPRRLRPVHAVVGRRGQQLHGDPQAGRRRRDLPLHRRSSTSRTSTSRRGSTPRSPGRPTSPCSTPSTVPMAQSNGVSLAKNGGTIQTLLIFDKTGVTAKPFGNKLVRLALSYAIDRAAFVAALAKGSQPDGERVPAGLAGLRPVPQHRPTRSATPRPSSCSRRPATRTASRSPSRRQPDRRGAARVPPEAVRRDRRHDERHRDHLHRAAVRGHQHPADGLHPAGVAERDRRHGGRPRRRLRQPAQDAGPGDRRRPRRRVQRDRRWPTRRRSRRSTTPWSTRPGSSRSPSSTPTSATTPRRSPSRSSPAWTSTRC